MSTFLKLSMSFVLAMFISGCGAITWLQANSTPLEYALKLGVIELIEKGDISAQAVVDTTNTALSYMDKNPSSKATDIVAFVRGNIPWDKLSPAQVILVESVLTGVEVKIAADIERGIISETDYASVKEVITWINEAAALSNR